MSSTTKAKRYENTWNNVCKHHYRSKNLDLVIVSTSTGPVYGQAIQALNWVEIKNPNSTATKALQLVAHDL
jgi:hypothetical protein